MLEQRFNVPAAVGHAKNKDIRIFDAVDDDIPINRIASSAGSQVSIACASQPWMIRKQEESVCKRSDLATSDFSIAAFADDVSPDVVQIGLGLGCEAVRH